MEAEQTIQTTTTPTTKTETVLSTTFPKYSPSLLLIFFLTILVTVVPWWNHTSGVSDIITILQITFYGAVGVAADVVNFKHTKLMLGKE
jgi:hypothetical protein